MLRRLIDVRRKLAWPHLVNAVGAAALLYVASHTILLTNAELSTVDTRFKLRGPVETPTETVIVGIDQQSYDDLAQTFPWPRAYFAKLLEKRDLRAADPKRDRTAFVQRASADACS